MVKLGSRRSLTDDGTRSRLVRRCQIVEEIVSSEESYVRDLKTLISVGVEICLGWCLLTLQVYLTILPKDRVDRTMVRKSATQILQLHEELLVELQEALGNANQSQDQSQSRPRRLFSRHAGWRSMDSSPPVAVQWDQIARNSIDTSRPCSRSFMADTQLVVGVAKVFDRLVSHWDLIMHHLTAQQMQRFVSYEAYAAYNPIRGEATLSTASWDAAERGIEALSSLTICAEKRDADRNKALSFRDLVVKVSSCLVRRLESNRRSLFRESASTHCFSVIFAGTRQPATIWLPTRNSKGCSPNCRPWQAR